MAENIIWGSDEACDEELINCICETENNALKEDKSSNGSVISLENKRKCQDDNAVLNLVPLTALCGGYLKVTFLTSQHWCEQQLLYNLTIPAEVTVEKPEISRGTELHLNRELEVHTLVNVDVSTREDGFAITTLNLLHSLEGFLQGVVVAREVPIYGTPFGQDIFIMGIIDELRCNLDSFELTLSEYKTRSVPGIPRGAQKETHKLQVMMYKALFDELVSGNFCCGSVAEKLNLNLNQKLSNDVRRHVAMSGKSAETLGDLLNELVEQSKYFPRITKLEIEYHFQDDNRLLGKVDINYDDQWLEDKFTYFASFWKGEREAKGVEIEEAWKCQKCDFAEICKWRKQRANKHSRKNKWDDT